MFKKRNLALFLAALMSVAFLAGGVCEDVKAGGPVTFEDHIIAAFLALDHEEQKLPLSGPEVDEKLKPLSSFITTEDDLSHKADLSSVDGIGASPNLPADKFVDTYGLDELAGKIKKDDGSAKYVFSGESADPGLPFTLGSIDFGEHLNAAANGGPESAILLINPCDGSNSGLDESNYKKVTYFDVEMNDGNLYFPLILKLQLNGDIDVNKLKVYHFIRTSADLDTYSGTEISFTDNGNGLITILASKNIQTTPSAEGGESIYDYYALEELKYASQQDPQEDPKEDPAPNPPTWIPQTPEEIKRFACLGSEKLEYSCSERNPYGIIFVKSVQGPKCFASFEAVLGDYTIGRTYSAYVNGRLIYSMPQKARVTLVIPETLRKEGRVFKMICVTKGGRPVIYNDLDKDPDTITFDTNKFYAYALIYK